MKMLIAFVQPHALPRLTQALQDIHGFPGMSVSICEGFGLERAAPEFDYSPFHHKRRLEIFAPDDLVDTIITTILQTAHSGNPGDGKVYEVDVLAGARIRTGERGPDIV